MKHILILANADVVAKEAGKVIAAEAHSAVATRGRFIVVLVDRVAEGESQNN